MNKQPEKHQDETEYLLSNEANKARLLQSIENVRNRKNLKEFTLEDLALSYLMSETNTKEVVDTEDFIRRLRADDNSAE